MVNMATHWAWTPYIRETTSGPTHLGEGEDATQRQRPPKIHPNAPPLS